MDENTTSDDVATSDPKKQLIQKAVILASAAVGILIATGIKLPKVHVDTDDPFEVAGDSDETTES